MASHDKIWEGGNRVCVRYIDMMPADPHARRGEFGSRALEPNLVDIGERQMAAAARQRQRNPAANLPLPVTTAVRPEGFGNPKLSHRVLDPRILIDMAKPMRF